jgi:hypothetical protein
MKHSQKRLLSAACLLPPTSRGNKGGFPLSTLYGEEARSAGSEAITAGKQNLTPAPGAKRGDSTQDIHKSQGLHRRVGLACNEAGGINTSTN